jgi:hypothetical protein
MRIQLFLIRLMLSGGSPSRYFWGLVRAVAFGKPPQGGDGNPHKASNPDRWQTLFSNQPLDATNANREDFRGRAFVYEKLLHEFSHQKEVSWRKLACCGE